MNIWISTLSIIISLVSLTLTIILFKLVTPLYLEITSLYKELYSNTNSKNYSDMDSKTIYEKGCMNQWLIIQYCLKKMQEDGDILDHESIILGLQEKVKSIPREILEQIIRGEDPIERS
ncbi:MAG: hypothetical protein ACOC1O_01590 [bacterium]